VESFAGNRALITNRGAIVMWKRIHSTICLTVGRPRASYFARLWFPVLAVLVAGEAFLAGRALGRRVGYQKPPSPVHLAAQPDTSEIPGLGLQVDRHGSDLRIRWNRSRQAMLWAKAGLLSIRDGAGLPQRTWTLNADQLQTGTVLYSPASDNVQFRLAVFGRDGRSATEWVLALGALRTSEPIIEMTPAVSQPYNTLNAAGPSEAERRGKD
jgi:hypothetical protein